MSKASTATSRRSAPSSAALREATPPEAAGPNAQQLALASRLISRGLPSPCWRHGLCGARVLCRVLCHVAAQVPHLEVREQWLNNGEMPRPTAVGLQADGPFKPMEEWEDIVGRRTHDQKPSVVEFQKWQQKHVYEATRLRKHASVVRLQQFSPKVRRVQVPFRKSRNQVKITGGQAGWDRHPDGALRATLRGSPLVGAAWLKAALRVWRPATRAFSFSEDVHRPLAPHHRRLLRALHRTRIAPGLRPACSVATAPCLGLWACMQ